MCRNEAGPYLLQEQPPAEALVSKSKDAVGHMETRVGGGAADEYSGLFSMGFDYRPCEYARNEKNFYPAPYFPHGQEHSH